MALAALIAAGCSDSPAGPAVSDADALAASAAAGGISAADFLRHLAVIADDSMRGRATPSREVELTATYVAAAFSAAGLTPGGDAGSFIQRYTLTALAANPTATAPNTVGILEGSDPVLRDEYVVIGAHMDHVGVTGGGQSCAAIGADSICNGANDNGSGTVAVMQLARALAGMAVRPKRTLVFATFAGEERGLWGSAAYARAPWQPLTQAAAVINVDMIGRNATDSLFVVGKSYSTLGAAVDRVSRAHRDVGMRLVDDAWNGTYFTRSDQWSFARLGVPTLFFFNGPHPELHTVRDEPGLMDADAAARAVRMILFTVLDVANAAQRPTWDAAAKARWVTPGAR
jgi:Zn-dependent M28 family amino/carboxypeptidase